MGWLVKWGSTVFSEGETQGGATALRSLRVGRVDRVLLIASGMSCPAHSPPATDRSPKWEHFSEPTDSHRPASRPVALGGAASFRRCDHARHWRTILSALINMSETWYY